VWKFGAYPLQKIEGLVRDRRRHRDTALVQRLARVRERHTELSHLLLRVMGKVRVCFRPFVTREASSVPALVLLMRVLVWAIGKCSMYRPGI